MTERADRPVAHTIVTGYGGIECGGCGRIWPIDFYPADHTDTCPGFARYRWGNRNPWETPEHRVIEATT